MIDSFGFVISGLPYTLGISLFSFVFGLGLGLVVALMRLSGKFYLTLPAQVFVSLLRGVPMIVVLFVLYFGLPHYGIQLSALLCALIDFSVVSSAYMSEIFRSAIGAVDQGQWEAARALGLPEHKVLRAIILPQAMRIALPPLGNVIIDMVKSSSLVAMITVPDIFQNAKIIGGSKWDYMSMYMLVGLIYWSLTFLLERGQSMLEKRLGLGR
ncbi:amino acid ABC transporter permease [Streptococcus cuniculipharyngis]|uniref:Amino acid ABC transporter permease n=1 Tax=Streptococcus cuniculipharyngis TaxID=1562651 RepID=A0A5C5S959_9STRE|nr:amino acid ABC transporter permease [Streptococcus cuniculipharyngis]TWS96946.1 amino acid ABC transporter permease [Streptococcus cuniculipharyngis]